MKKIFFAIIILILFIVGSVITECKLKESSDSILKDINILIKQIEEENWTKVDKNLENMVEKWEEISTKWAVLVEHEEIDGITISLYKAKAFANSREKEESLAEMREFEFMIDHIPKIHKVELKNIF